MDERTNSKILRHGSQDLAGNHQSHNKQNKLEMTKDISKHFTIKHHRNYISQKLKYRRFPILLVVRILEEVVIEWVELRIPLQIYRNHM